MNKTISTYWLYVKQDIKSQLKYPLDFSIQLIIWTIYTIIPYLGLNILFYRFGQIGEWSLYHVGILYSIIGLSYDFSRMIGRAYDDFHKLMRRGDLDIFLSRPQSLTIQIMGSQFFLRRLAGIINYIVIFYISLRRIDFINIQNPMILICCYIVIILATIFIFLGLLIIYAATCIFTIKKNSFSDIFIDTIAQISYLPNEYMNSVMKYLLLSIVPLSITTYYPVKSLFFGTNISQVYLQVFFALIVGIIFFLLSQIIFRFALRYYKSCGN